MNSIKLLVGLTIAVILMGSNGTFNCGGEVPPTPEEPVVAEPVTPEPCNEGLCVKDRMPVCLAQAGNRLNKNTVLSWLEICEKPPIALSDVVDGMQGKTTGCFVCVDERNTGYLTWRHQFHVSHGLEDCQTGN